MTSLVYLLLSFRGRISRKSWWIGTLILVVASIAGTLTLNPSVFDYERQAPRIPSWPDTIWQLALVIPRTALIVKRFNDRDHPYWLGYAFGVLGALLVVGPQFGIFAREPANAFEIVVAVIFGVAVLFAFVDNGFLRGNMGPNRYGPDPLATRELFR